MKITENRGGKHGMEPVKGTGGVHFRLTDAERKNTCSWVEILESNIQRPVKISELYKLALKYANSNKEDFLKKILDAEKEENQKWNLTPDFIKSAIKK